MAFDPTITLGNVVTSAAFLVGISGAYYALVGRIAVIERLFILFSDRVEKLEGAFTVQAAQLNRLVGHHEALQHTHQHGVPRTRPGETGE